MSKAKIDIETIRKLREKTGAPVMRVKKVLTETSGDMKKAEKKLLAEGFEKAKKRSGRDTNQGLVVTYQHHSGKVASMVELLCETDFVARNDLFNNLANDLAMQVASMNPKDAKVLKSQDFIKDPSQKVVDLINKVKVKTGENITLGRFYRVELGK